MKRDKMCKFCDYYNITKQMYKKWQADQELSDYKHKHKVKMVTYTYNKKIDYRKSSIRPSFILSRSFELRYCPLCGKKLIKERKKEEKTE